MARQSLSALEAQLVRTASDIPRADVHEMRKAENDRLDSIDEQACRYADSSNPGIAMGGCALRLKISERRAKLNGLDAPAKTEVTVNAGVLATPADITREIAREIGRVKGFARLLVAMCHEEGTAAELLEAAYADAAGADGGEGERMLTEGSAEDE